MKLKRVKGGKGKRWKKGHSCASNPETATHRELAKGNFFQKLDGFSGLTVEALAEHTAALAVGAKLHADPQDDKSIGKSMKTFATNFTTCTIPAFEKFFKNFSVDSELQTRMLAIHAAAQEYIQDANLAESSTSYMCALMVSLEGVKDSEDDVTATLCLISKVIRKVSPEVLKAKFGEYAKLFDDIFTSFANASNSKLLINVIGCLSRLLRAQDEAQWTYPYTMNIFQKIVSYTTHQDNDIRRAAQYNSSAVLTGSSFMISEDAEGNDETESTNDGASCKEEDHSKKQKIHPAANSVGKFIILNLKLAAQNMNGKATLFLLIFLQQIIASLPKTLLEQCCARVLGIMHVGDAVVNSRAMKVFGTLFKAPSLPSLTPETNKALLNALTAATDADGSRPSLRLVPGMNDAELSITWMNVISAGIVRLTKSDEAFGMEKFNSWIKQLTNFWKSDHESVHEQIWFVIDYLFDEIIKPLEERICNYSQLILNAFKETEKCLSLQFQPAWPYVFSSLVPFFKVLGPLVPSEMIMCLKTLSTMMDSTTRKGKFQLENAIGAAIHGMSPEEVMKVVPLQVTGDIKVDENYFWILPVLRKYVKNARLCFFESHFVRLANKCFIIIDNLKKQGKLDSLLGKTYQLIELQIWALFPSFANEAVDIEKAVSIQSFAKLICDHIKFREDTRIDIMAGLRNMIKCSEPSGKLSLYGKNYLPTLFNIYLMKPRNKVGPGSKEGTVENGQRLSALTTIEAYLGILPTFKCIEFFDLIIKRFEAEESDSFKRKALLGLSRLFLPHVPISSLNTLFTIVQVVLGSNAVDFQKICFRIMEDMLSVESEQCKLFVEERKSDILSLIDTSAASVALNAKGARLKWLSKIFSLLPEEEPEENREELLRKVVKEAVSCCGKKNSSITRKTAFGFLSDVGMIVQKTMKLSSEDTFLYCFGLLPNLLPPSDLTANTIVALMALSYQYQEMMPMHILHVAVEDISSLLQSEDRDIVKASLSYIRVVFVLYPYSVLSDHVDNVVENVVAMKDSERKKFRLKIRDILASLVRRYGADRIQAIIPEEDTMQKVLTNIVKKENRRKRNKKLCEENEEEEEEIAPTTLDEILLEIDKEVENDEKKPVLKGKMLKDKNRSKKKQTWIKEDEDVIVDLLDSSFGQNILSRKPKIKRLRFEDEEEKTPLTDEQKYGFRLDKKTKKFIIVEKDFESKKHDEDSEDDERIFDDLPIGPQQSKNEKQPGKRKRKLSEDSDDSIEPPSKYGPGDSKARRVKKKFDYGAEFRAKKAGGDVAKKGGVAPYAYVQFSKEKLNKRKRAKYAGQFKSLVKGAKKGALRGTKGKARRK